jgi:hypothetical protein
MGMLYSDQVLGRPLEYGEETESMKKLAGVTRHGYRGNLQSIANKLDFRMVSGRDLVEASPVTRTAKNWGRASMAF